MHRSKKEPLLYRLIGAQQDRLRDTDPQRLGSLEVDGELELARLLDRKFRRFGTLQQPCDLISGKGVEVRKRDAITGKAAGFDHVPPLANRRDSRRSAQLPELL